MEEGAVLSKESFYRFLKFRGMGRVILQIELKKDGEII